MSPTVLYFTGKRSGVQTPQCCKRPRLCVCEHPTYYLSTCWMFPACWQGPRSGGHRVGAVVWLLLVRYVHALGFDRVFGSVLPFTRRFFAGETKQWRGEGVWLTSVHITQETQKRRRSAGIPCKRRDWGYRGEMRQGKAARYIAYPLFSRAQVVDGQLRTSRRAALTRSGVCQPDSSPAPQTGVSRPIDRALCRIR